MSQFQVARAVLGLALLALLQAAALAADFTPAQAEAAREGLQDAVALAVTKAVAAAEDVDLPPYISQSVQKVALVTVESVKEAKNVKLSKLSSLQRDGAFGADPIVANKTVSFTLPLKLDHPQITGVFTRKVNGVGAEGNFTTTIGVLRLEAEGTATVGPDACSFNITSVKDVEVNQVDTVVEGSVLNSLLASKVTAAVNKKKLGVGEPVARILLARFQAADKDCTADVRARLKTVPAAAAPAA